MLPLLFALAATPGAQPPNLPPVAPQPAQPHCPIPECPAATKTPTWDKLFPPVLHCPGPAVPPFFKQPRVCLVPVCLCDEGISLPTPSWVKEFSCPAFVPLPQFDQEGHPLWGDGLVIYEGMRLTVYPESGFYDLTFTATVPNMPVTLRMQLTFTKYEKEKPTHERYTLTLPPIRMEMPRDTRPGDPTTKTFHIAHRGYSTLFVKAMMPPNTLTTVATDGPGCNRPATIDCHWEVRRDGTARFGTPVAIEDPNR